MPSVVATAAAELDETAAGGLAAGGETVKLTPHFLHLIRLPIKLGGILPRSPQLGHVTKAIVQTSPRMAAAFGPTSARRHAPNERNDTTGFAVRSLGS